MFKDLACSLVLMAVLSIGSSCSYGAEPTKDSLSKVKENIQKDDAVLVDVREKSEWDAGHISDAIFLPLSDLRKGMSAELLAKRLPKEKIVYTHCMVGVRSCSAADILKKHGYELRPLKPGYKELLAAGFKKAE